MSLMSLLSALLVGGEIPDPVPSWMSIERSALGSQDSPSPIAPTSGRLAQAELGGDHVGRDGRPAHDIVHEGRQARGGTATLEAGATAAHERREFAVDDVSARPAQLGSPDKTDAHFVSATSLVSRSI